MLKKIYKNNGYIYIPDKGKNDIKLNNIILKLYIIKKDTLSYDKIINLSKKEYYKSLGCSYDN